MFPTRVWSKISLVLLGMVVASVFQPLHFISSFAQGGCQTFPQTNKTVCGRFLEYWQTHGGLAQQGYPISNPFTEVSDLNGTPYTVQYFERAVFEVHPENAPPNDVLLSQLGTFQFKRKYPQGEPAGGVQPPPAQQPPAQPPSGIVGQALDVVGAFEARLHIVARSVRETKTLAGQHGTYTARGKYVVVFTSVTNTSTDNESWIHEETVKLTDDQGRRYDLKTYPEANAAADQYYRDYVGTFIKPGLTAEEVFVFDAAPDAANYKLIPAQQ
jgi:hypothetical protein